jgi:hypothetical protein
MLHRKLFSLALIAAAVALPVQAVFASSTPERVTVGYTGNQKMIKLSVRNTSSTPLDLRLGDQTVTIAPGKTMDLKLPVGTKITTASDTPRTPSGTLILEVSPANSNTLVSIS